MIRIWLKSYEPILDKKNNDIGSALASYQLHMLSWVSTMQVGLSQLLKLQIKD